MDAGDAITHGLTIEIQMVNRIYAENAVAINIQLKGFRGGNYF